MIATVERKYDALFPEMNEKLKRHWAACEAMALGRGGISEVSRATGLSRNTIRKGIREVEEGMPHLVEEIERVRRPGGGRPPASDVDTTLEKDLQWLVEASTRGHPVSPLVWTCKSTRKIADELRKQGHEVSHVTVSHILRKLGYSLQANRKTREGKQHPDRDAQFRFIARQVRSFQRRHQPVISVDTKNKEKVGDFKNPGREWHEKGKPEKVRLHDFRDKEWGVAIPYGVYDPTQNEGWVSVGVDHDTAQFAVATIRQWWLRMGRRVYPNAKELLITADAGGSNGYRTRLWKYCIQQLADETGLKISVSHFPPGTSKWNKIEHSMFCHITHNWRGRPLLSTAVIVNLIGNTTTREGLRIRSTLDTAAYPQGIKITDEQIATIRLRKKTFHGDWNYIIQPHT